MKRPERKQRVLSPYALCKSSASGTQVNYFCPSPAFVQNMAEQPDEIFEAAQGRPLPERLVHQHWRVRQHACEELEKKYKEAFDGNASIFKATSWCSPGFY
jgi:hypothetical protein